ncbi:hypothetical protein RHGRI_034165 [Rhododendron griersonianum]|uniref:Uncharacterized protein n=1 Tax=Rhododendron griersonianum TaxID=479676 RepID=A0AAV6I241_9ERIC|nr:hypothetical protein RHGRI_034165 [Rhododendron griersonianum]
MFPASIFKDDLETRSIDMIDVHNGKEKSDFENNWPIRHAKCGLQCKLVVFSVNLRVYLNHHLKVDIMTNASSRLEILNSNVSFVVGNFR